MCNTSAIPGQQARRNLNRINQCQADKDQHYGDVTGTPKNVSAKNAEKEERYSHPAIRLGARVDISPVGHREPMNTVSREGEAGHI